MKRNMFSDKTVWITGASSGIGEALSRQLSMYGARLVISGRNCESLERIAEQCSEAGNPVRPIVKPFDISDHAQFPSIVRDVTAAVGAVDILINNAGVGQRSDALSCRPDTVKKIMNVNFFGPVFLTQELLPSMIGRGAGRIVVVASVLGKFHLPGRSAYSASKHALIGYFNTLRAELSGSGIGVTIVCPGWIATSISQNALTADGTRYEKATLRKSSRMSAETCSRHIIRAIAAQKNEATMGGIETLGGLLYTLSPRLFDRVVRKQTAEFHHTLAQSK